MSGSERDSIQKAGIVTEQSATKPSLASKRAEIWQRFDVLSERVVTAEKLVEEKYFAWVRTCEMLKVCERQRREVWLELLDTVSDTQLSNTPSSEQNPTMQVEPLSEQAPS